MGNMVNTIAMILVANGNYTCGGRHFIMYILLNHYVVHLELIICLQYFS